MTIVLFICGINDLSSQIGIDANGLGSPLPGWEYAIRKMTGMDLQRNIREEKGSKPQEQQYVFVNI
jgi:hypothetical protein